MKSQSKSPSAIIFDTYCMTVSYGRIGYAVITSTSASRTAWAIASLPLISSSVSVRGAITKSANDCFGATVSTALIGDLLGVLAHVVEPVAADGLPRNPFRPPSGVGLLVLGPHPPLALVVREGLLVDHGDAVGHRADRLADAAAAARLHVGVVMARS